MSNLEDKCPNCKHEMVEETHIFESEELAVSVCSHCDFHDWIIPKKCLDGEEEETFERSEIWARETAKEMRRRLHLPKIEIHFSNEAIKRLGKRKESLELKITELLQTQNLLYAEIGKRDCNIIQIWLWLPLKVEVESVEREESSTSISHVDESDLHADNSLLPQNQKGESKTETPK